MSTHWTTRDGVKIAWSDLDDRHLWNIVRLLTRDARMHTRAAERSDAEMHRARIERFEAAGDLLSVQYLRRRGVENSAASYRITRRMHRADAHSKRRALSLAVDEVARRGLLPTVDDLRVAWDRACGGDGGPNVADDPVKRPWCLVELWVGFRGVSTFTPEWLAAQQAQPRAHSS